MTTRIYDFITGVDQTMPPTGSTPTGDNDFITVAYAATKYARFEDSVAALKAVTPTTRADALPIYVKSLDAWFQFDAASAVTGDDENIITPTTGTGRWLRIQWRGMGQSANVATAATIAALASATPVVRLTGSTLTTLQGIAAGITSQVLTIFNASSAVVTMAHENGSASAADRIVLPSSVALAIAPNGAAFLRYDKALTRWVLISSSGSGGGAGGMRVKVNLDVDAPFQLFLNNTSKLRFTDALAQQCFFSFKVPAGYQLGSPIALKSLFDAAGSAGTVLFQTVATLIRAGIDSTSSTTNQRTSTNAAITQTVGTSGVEQPLSNDLTSSSGQINGVDVSPGDFILVKFSRGTDTATFPADLLEESLEVTFS